MTLSAVENRYPRAGNVAVLCEGDVAGFEVDLIEKWTADTVPNVMVDVWACGTQDSIFGVADSIGRSRPLIVVEDRDYRTPVQASSDCERKRKDRVKRAVAVSKWQAWGRNEIENYLIEPAVIVPVLADYFQINDEGVVRARLSSVVDCLRVDQAAQFALHQFQHSIPSKSRYVGGLPKKMARPCWDTVATKIVSPERAIVKTALETVLKQKAELYARDGECMNYKQFLDQFESKCDEWNDVTFFFTCLACRLGRQGCPSLLVQMASCGVWNHNCSRPPANSR